MTTGAQIDLKEPVEISADTYWVGRREGTLLERNVYLRVFKRAGHGAINLVIDPGPPDDLMEVSRKVGKVAGHLKNVNVVFINHQDPDVGYNAGYMQKMNPNLTVLCSEDTWRLIRFYGLDAKHHRPVEKFKGMSVTLSTGHVISFVPTPFCHFRGAAMLYDHETRILFTGDLLGGLSYAQDLYADKRSWEGMKTFHQIYMPTREALELAVRNIRALDPPPLILAPQHGSIIAGEWVDYYLDRLPSLQVGLNLILDSQRKENYVAAMNELLVELNPVLGAETIAKAVRVFSDDGTFPNVVLADERGVRDIKVDLETAVDVFTKSLVDQSPEHADMVEMATLKVLLGRNIPLPERMIGNGSAPAEFFEHA